MREQLARILLACPRRQRRRSSACWAGFAPRSFYDDFPGLGRHWVVGRTVRSTSTSCATSAGSTSRSRSSPLIAAVTLARAAVRGRGGARSSSPGVPHLVYHLAHLDLFATGDQIGNVVALVLGPDRGVGRARR